MSQTAFVLIYTDDEQRGERLREAIRQRKQHSCSVVGNLRDALASVRSKTPDVVVADAHMNGTEAISKLIELLDERAADATLLTVGKTDAKRHARNVHVSSLPADAPLEELVAPINAEAGKAVARREDRLLRESVARAEIESFEGIVGASRLIRQIAERVKKVARTKLTVLILGESGTGKELIAKAIHKHSDRSNGPEKHLDCAGLNENLLESELFGHARGAFTSAHADRKGYFEAAHGGTLFLDEIGDMPLTMQAKLLRALENREITPVGTTDVRRIDVRVIAATHRNLAEMMDEGQFREDLYYRLHQFVIEVPSLRERREDIPLLTHHFIQQANEEHGMAVPGISNEAVGYLSKFYWPGNVRELAHTVATLVVEAESRQIEVDDLPERISGTRALVSKSGAQFTGLSLAEIEKLAIQHTLQVTQGNRERAAAMLGIGTRTLYRKIKEYDLT